MTVKYKLLLPIVAAVVIGIAGIQVVTGLKSADVLEAEIFNAVDRDATVAATQIHLWLVDRETDLTNWCTLGVYSEALEGAPSALYQVGNILDGKIKHYPYYDGLNLIDRRGLVVASNNRESVGLDLSSREYVSRALTGEAVVSDPLISKTSGVPVFTIAVPVRSGGGAILGVFSGVVTFQDLSDRFVDGIKIGQTGYAFVVDKNAKVLAHPNKDFVLKLSVSERDFGKAMLAERNGHIKYYFEEQKAWKGMAYHEVDRTSWIVAVSAPLDELMAPLSALTQYSIIGGVIITILVALVILYFVTAMVRTLSRTSGLMAELAEGDVSSDVPEKMTAMNDELGDLSRSCQSLILSQRERASVAQSIAKGDLTRSVTVNSEKDMLGNALKGMTDSLNEIMRGVDDAAQQVAAGSSEVSDSSQQLSQGATEQAASIEEINSSMTELGSQTRANAEKAAEANRMAEESSRAANEGNDRMARMTQAMNGIAESSQAIAKIIKVIDEIAFQTNLLALNAAVEAARAGRHGKGFAVVAEEVRNLAGRSAKAAEETTQLIESSVARVEEGSEAASLTAETLERISQETASVARLLQDIARASSEQAEGISQVGDGLNQIDQVTQQNTASAEETASAAEELSAQSSTLRQLLSRFRLRGGERSVTVHSSRPQALPGADRSREGGNRPAGPAPSRPAPRRAPENDGWGGNQSPEEIISLDDADFGKY
jgi:methyl-accepting chemotaxis protein